MNRTATVFYHCWADGKWEAPLGEFLTALRVSRFRGSLHVGLIGNEGNRLRVKYVLDRERVLHGRESILYESENGWEQSTLGLVDAHAFEHDGIVIYAHTKGATRPDPVVDAWRKKMYEYVVLRWRENLRSLEEYDVIGWVWLDKRVGWKHPAFVGNCWAARCDYLRSLPPVSEQQDRVESELWVGQGNPRILEREAWDLETGPSALKPIWPLLLARWRALEGNNEVPRGIDEEVWRAHIEALR